MIHPTQQLSGSALSAFAKFLVQEMTSNVGEAKKTWGKNDRSRSQARVIGTYDYKWPQLAPSTQEKRVSEGFSANEPLG
jgi:hypothetical protein